MRKSVVILGAVIGALSAALAAQEHPSPAPAMVVEFDPAGVPYDNNYRPPCGGEVHQRARQRHEEREAARIAAGGNPRRRMFLYTCETATSAAPATAAAAQNQAPLPVAFELAAQPTAARPAQAAPVMVQTDLNGNPISPSPARDCTRERAAALRQHLTAEDARLAADPEAQRSRFEFACDTQGLAQASAASANSNSFGFGRNAFAVTNASNGDAPTYSRSPATSSSASRSDDDDVRVEREYTEGCTETLFETTCSSSGSVTIGNSAEGRSAARAELDRLLSRDD